MSRTILKTTCGRSAISEKLFGFETGNYCNSAKIQPLILDINANINVNINANIDTNSLIGW